MWKTDEGGKQHPGLQSFQLSYKGGEGCKQLLAGVSLKVVWAQLNLIASTELYLLSVFTIWYFFFFIA